MRWALCRDDQVFGRQAVAGAVAPWCDPIEVLLLYPLAHGCVEARLARRLLAGLAPVVEVSVRGSKAGVWLEASLRYALAEARSPSPGGGGSIHPSPDGSR